MIGPGNATQPFSEGTDAIHEWKSVVAVLEDFERSWRDGEQPTVSSFVQKYPKLASHLLITELERLNAELQCCDETSEPMQVLGQGRYAELRSLHVGGMGEIFSALDVVTGRTVALKTIRREFRDNPEVRRRFQTELKLTASLEHPGVIPVYAQGIDDDGNDYYVMRLIAGSGTGTLKQAVQRFHSEAAENCSPVTLRVNFCGLVQRILDVALTISYAHGRGIVHRDIKPSNILIGPYGETLVADWGLARYEKAAGECAVEFSGRIMLPEHNLPDGAADEVTSGVGTPGYAAPEQDSGKFAAADLRRCDIYSLGAVLRCMITGASDAVSDIVHPRYLDSVGGLRGLVAIADHALQANPDRRYSRVEDFCQDLKRWLSGEPVSVYRERCYEWVWSWPRRHRLAATAVFSSLLIGFCSGCFFLLVQLRQNAELKSRSEALALALSRSDEFLRQAEKARRLAEDLRNKTEIAQSGVQQALAEAESREVLAFAALNQFYETINTNTNLRYSADLSTLRSDLLSQWRKLHHSLFEQVGSETNRNKTSLQRLYEAAMTLARMENECGNPQEAFRVIGEAIAIVRKSDAGMSASSPLRFSRDLRLGQLLTRQGHYAFQCNWVERAGPLLEEAVRTLDPLQKFDQFSDFEREELRTAISNSTSSLGMQVYQSGDRVRAKSLLFRSLHAASQLPVRSVEQALLLFQCYGNLAVILENEQNYNGAQDQLLHAECLLFIAESLQSEESPVQQKISLQMVKSKFKHQQAKFTECRGNSEECIQILSDLLHHESNLLRDYSGALSIQAAYMKTASRLVDSLMKMNRINDAELIADGWIRLAGKLRASSGATPQSQSFLAAAQACEKRVRGKNSDQILAR